MPEIIVTSGDIFESGCYALVSPVDCTGAQGKGLALEFRRRWPERCAAYRRDCQRGRVRAGQVVCNDREHPIVLFAATKQHYRESSEIAYVKECLDGIEWWTRAIGVQSVAIPALGCGLGSLSWTDVRPLMLDAAARMQCDVVKIYEPR